jgi:hypothetical protein
MQVRSRLDVCFQRDPDPHAVARALERLAERATHAADPDRSHGAVTGLVAFAAGVPVPGGLFDPAIFGGPHDIRYGHVDVDGVAIAGVPARRIPIPPIADRPVVPIDDPAARLPWLGAANDAWTAVIAWAARQRRAHDQRGDAALREQVRERLQAAVDDAFATARGERPPRWPPAEAAAHELAFVRPAAATADPPVVRAMLFLDDRHLVIQTCRGCVIVDRDGREVLRFRPVGTIATSVHGDRIVFAGDQRDLASWYDDAPCPPGAPATAPIAVCDAAHGRWLQRGTLGGQPRFVIDETDVDGSEVRDLATGRSTWLAPADLQPTSIAHTRDGRFAWLAFGERPGSGLVYELATAIPFVEPASPPDELPAIELGAPLELATAVAWTPARGWRLFHPCGAVGDHARSWARVIGARAAAFSPDAGTLALATDDEIRFVAADDPAHVLAAFEWRT